MHITGLVRAKGTTVTLTAISYIRSRPWPQGSVYSILQILSKVIVQGTYQQAADGIVSFHKDAYS